MIFSKSKRPHKVGYYYVIYLNGSKPSVTIAHVTINLVGHPAIWDKMDGFVSVKHLDILWGDKIVMPPFEIKNGEDLE